MENAQPIKSEVLDAIEAHRALCEEVYDFLLEENRIYRRSGRPLEDGLIERKRLLLSALTGSLDRLRRVGRAGGVAKSSFLKDASAKTQRILLKAMLLDKENEQLLLKHALSSSSGQLKIAAKPTEREVRRKYQGQE
ncbi:MAG: hypothetical protein RLZZ399_2005 [Verrucomicrobiota bacterium]|jgi:hypothetical protein